MKVEIIGHGNVATHLYKALNDKADVSIINSRTLEGMAHDADIFIIAVPDHAIKDVAERIKAILNQQPPHGLIVHTSGTTPMNVLSPYSGSIGVFYPLQTFSRDTPLNYSEIPLFIESDDPESVEILRRLAGMFTTHIYEADSERRRHLHLASVMACNFVNHLWALSDQYLNNHDMEFSMLVPLIKETMRKAMVAGPTDVQTGPAVRRDETTMSAHLEMLHDNPDIQQMYRLLSESIIKFDKHKHSN